ncbi:MAG: hypothetical protein HOI95_04255, partial [Chromatiales bacterium]|nr:hypothetical protein [Chromatiales bacterium]
MSLSGYTRSRLRVWICVFFVAVAVPTGALIYKAYDQLKWESFHRSRLLAEELAERIDTRLTALVQLEEARAFTDYSFLVLAGDPSAGFLQRSSLSNFPVKSQVPGLLGYFQIDDDGRFTSPLLPTEDAALTNYGVAPEEQRLRHELYISLEAILQRNQLAVTPRPVARPPSLVAARRVDQVASVPTFALSDEAESQELKEEVANLEAEERPWAAAEVEVVQRSLNELAKGNAPATQEQSINRLGRVEDLKLTSDYEQRSVSRARNDVVRQATKAKKDARSARKETSALPRPSVQPESDKARVPPPVAIATFESELDPFEFSLLNSGHFVLYRNVWRNGKRYVQGAIVDQSRFVRAIEQSFRNSLLPGTTRLAVAFSGSVLTAFDAQISRRYLSTADELSGALLYRTRLSEPLSKLELLFTITQLSTGPGTALVSWLAVILFLVLCV